MLAQDALKSMSDHNEILGYYKAAVETQLQSFLSAKLQNYELGDSVQYAALTHGKRIRPLIALCLAHDLKISTDQLLLPVIALELVHASSLVHDDLPAIDNDDYRRGKPSCHKAYGEAKAILTGDILITLAFEAVAESELPPRAVVQMVRQLAAAYSAVCEGQQRDLVSVPDTITEVHRLKTASLFEAAAFFGVICAGNDELTRQASVYGQALGLYFQAYNDFLDLFGSADEQGRPGGSDTRNQKTTLYTKRNFREAKSDLDSLRERAGEALSSVETCPVGGDQNECALTRQLLFAIDLKVASISESGA